jgi:hypothetical protein
MAESPAGAGQSHLISNEKADNCFAGFVAPTRLKAFFLNAAR